MSATGYTVVSECMLHSTIDIQIIAKMAKLTAYWSQHLKCVVQLVFASKDPWQVV